MPAVDILNRNFLILSKMKNRCRLLCLLVVVLLICGGYCIYKRCAAITMIRKGWPGNVPVSFVYSDALMFPSLNDEYVKIGSLKMRFGRLGAKLVKSEQNGWVSLRSNDFSILSNPDGPKIAYAAMRRTMETFNQLGDLTYKIPSDYVETAFKFKEPSYVQCILMSSEHLKQISMSRLFVGLYSYRLRSVCFYKLWVDIVAVYVYDDYVIIERFNDGNESIYRFQVNGPLSLNYQFQSELAYCLAMADVE